jgi:hypothetical protein
MLLDSIWTLSAYRFAVSDIRTVRVAKSDTKGGLESTAGPASRLECGDDGWK